MPKSIWIGEGLEIAWRFSLAERRRPGHSFGLPVRGILFRLRGMKYLAILLSFSFWGLAEGARAEGVPGLPPVEHPLVLDAEAILKPEFVHGPHFAVRREVSTRNGVNSYTIDSDYGTFTAEGNAALVERVTEVQAIAMLKEISRSDSYKKALAKAAQSPLKFAQSAIEHPVDTVGGISQGVWKMLNGAGQSVKEVGQGRPQSRSEDSMGEDVIGFSAVKRKIAVGLGVDPYSTNEALQKELKGVAWAAFAGQMTVAGAMMPIGGTAGLALRSVNMGGSSLAALRDLSPADLRLRNLKVLLGMGIDRGLANAFLNNPVLSPTNQTIIVDALEKLPGAAGRDGFIRLVATAKSETEGLRYQLGARLVATLGQSQPISAITAFHRVPLAMTPDGTLIAPLMEWDYAAWTATAERFVRTMKGSRVGGRPVTALHIYLTGLASPAAKEGAVASQVALTEKALPGPLK